MGAWIMAGVTLREAARKRVLWMALAAGLAFLALFGAGLHSQVKDFREHPISPLLRGPIMNGLLMVGLYAVDLLTMVMAVLTSVDTVSGEVASGTIHAVATKPISRWQILMGKWLGFACMLTVYILLMVGGTTALAHWISGATAHHFLRGMALIWLESILLVTVTLLFGTSFSTLTNGVLALGLHGLAFLGGWIEQFGAITHTSRAVTVGIVASLIMPSESLWRRAVFEMQSPVMGAISFSPFTNSSTPSPMMIIYAAAYTLAALGLAMYRFSRRDL
jgi:Cu-processing system permease protein